MDRNSIIKRIHVLKRDLDLDEDTYGDVLGAISDGRTSCVQLDEEELNLVRIALERQLAGRQSGTSTTRKNAKQQDRIAKLGFLLQWSWRDIAGFCEKQTGKRSTRSCNASQLTKVINGMVQVINDKLAAGTLTLPHSDLQKFLDLTQSHRKSVRANGNSPQQMAQPS
jgi:phage gp16-like protein